MPPRYQPLTEYLAALPPEIVRATLTLAEVAVLIGRPLPLSAYAATWWVNSTGRVHGAAWLSVGWRVSKVALRVPVPTITFTQPVTDTIA